VSNILYLMAFDGVPGLEVPFLLEAKGRCPLEDIGGPWGYMEFLDAITDPKHDLHEEFTEWQDVGFDSAAPPRLGTFRYPIREPTNGKLRSRVAAMSQSGPHHRPNEVSACPLQLDVSGHSVASSGLLEH
jgi:Plasmid pRiA4b ORF-3-like protein